MATRLDRPSAAATTIAEVLWQRTGERSSFLSWAQEVPEPKTGTLDFKRFPYQLELYDPVCADAREVVVKKATQVGVSTWLTRWVMYGADARGLTALYVFPKRAQMYDFADARIRAAIMISPYLLGRIEPGHVNNKGLKKIGLGYLYCRGSESRDDLQAVDADLLALDEYDDLRQENVPDAERRVTGSQVGLIRRVGVPSVPGYGVDRLYNESDQRRWMIRCDRCNLIQHLTYDDNVDERKAQLKCGGCHKGPLDPSTGEWVAAFPDRDVRGYHMPRLIVPGLDLASIIDAHYRTQPSEVEAHHNKDLGEAFAPAEGRLTLTAIEAAQRPDIPRQATTQETDLLRTMGVDVASTRKLNVRVSEHMGNHKRNLYLGTADDFSELVRLFERYDPNLCCIDHLPEGRLARAFSERFPGRVFLANYGTQNEVLRVNPELRTASVRRVAIIDAMLDAIRQQRNLLPADLPGEYVRDLQNLIRVTETDEDGRVKQRYQELGPSDYAHAEAYDTLAAEVWWWLRSVEDANTGEITTLDELYDFERAELDVHASPEYDPGFG